MMSTVFLSLYALRSKDKAELIPKHKGNVSNKELKKDRIS